jgi:very-short-patch-repair endonuclease
LATAIPSTLPWPLPPSRDTGRREGDKRIWSIYNVEGEEGWDCAVVESLKITIQGGNMIRRKYSKNQYIKFRIAKRFRQTMTPSERLLWSRLRGNQLLGLHFRRQNVIRGFIVDFYCHRANLVVEIDGNIHNSQIEADTVRDNILKSLGLIVLHISNERVEKNLESAICEIQEICMKQTPDLENNTAEEY